MTATRRRRSSPAERATSTIAVGLCFLLIPRTNAFTVNPAAPISWRSLSAGFNLRLSSVASVENAEGVKSGILEAIKPTRRGLSTTFDQRVDIEEKISLLERMCPVKEPARDRRVGGHWFVRYTTAPPPSNGQLGPFVGVAEQEIGLESGSYQNILNVGDNAWLAATLDATWTEWDGQLLEEKSEEGRKKWMEGAVQVEGVDGDEEPEEASSGGGQDGAVNSPPLEGVFYSIQTALGGTSDQGNAAEEKKDFGATSWRVAFGSLTVRLFGFPIVTKKFDEGTDRVWKMTYIDDDTRVVRAGRTGKSEDDVVFYMTREPDA